jgi:hypothetical protein
MSMSMLVPYVAPMGPVYDWVCLCKKECHRFIDAVEVNAFRNEIWSGEYESLVIKEKILSARTGRFNNCCVSTLCHVAACSNQFLYHTHNGATSANNVQRSRSDISIMAWFEELLPLTDKMPDTNWYLLSAGTLISCVYVLFRCVPLCTLLTCVHLYIYQVIKKPCTSGMWLIANCGPTSMWNVSTLGLLRRGGNIMAIRFACDATVVSPSVVRV